MYRRTFSIGAGAMTLATLSSPPAHAARKATGDDAIAQDTWAPVRPEGGLRELVRAGTLAANSHNTQPWRFTIAERQITIGPDLSRRCPAMDPDDHHLFASLGCAVENIVQAVRPTAPPLKTCRPARNASAAVPSAPMTLPR